MSSVITLASLKRRYASVFYEILLLLAVWFLAGYAVVGLYPEPPQGWARLWFQLYLILVGGIYFVWFWRHGGQTLAMKTWHLKVVDASGGRVSLGQAWLRYALAVAGTVLAGLGFLWAFIDKDHQFLHDRLSSTRVVLSAPFDRP